MPDLQPLEIPDYLSPELAATGRVTVRYFHPHARAVWLQAEWDDWRPAAMRRDPAGLWSVTSRPLAPDIYEYSLFADGVPVVDYRNRWGRHRFAALVQVPGKVPAFHDLRDVPHGATHTHWYPSSATGETRRLHVYTPPGYEASQERYPILYLLHGSGDDDATWIHTGRVHWMLDNLIARGEVVPMIVAMPCGHVLGTVWKEDRKEKIALFTKEFHACVMPFTEQRYRTRPGAGARAMAGLSMGGGQTICAGLARPGLFHAIGIFSAGLWPEVVPFLQEALAELGDSPPQVLWIGMGRRDFLYPRCTALRETLAGAGVPFQFHEDDSAHTWRAWRDYFLRFAPLLFRTP